MEFDYLLPIVQPEKYSNYSPPQSSQVCRLYSLSNDRLTLVSYTPSLLSAVINFTSHDLTHSFSPSVINLKINALNCGLCSLCLYNSRGVWVMDHEKWWVVWGCLISWDNCCGGLLVIETWLVMSHVVTSVYSMTWWYSTWLLWLISVDMRVYWTGLIVLDCRSSLKVANSWSKVRPKNYSKRVIQNLKLRH